MLPPNNKTFEKVKTGDFINGDISDIKYDMEHKSTWKGEEKIKPAVRIIFKLDGYKYDHGTKWLTFNYGERSTLYNKYLVKLVDNATPYMRFDLDNLKGMKVKTIWAEHNDFQEPELIQPVGEKIKYVASSQAQDTEEAPDEEEAEEESTDSNEIPF